MAKSTQRNGHNRLEEAMATLIQNQAAFVSQQAEYNREHAELERCHLDDKRESDDRFLRIEGQMAEIIRVLNEHSRILERLPDAIRDKTSFRPPQ